ncbi:MAG: hypothetical protein Q7T74_07375 [Candidatus Saccharibacteria bacterium]|nr:hypothetical protein [Candidatus Saccharibacteria bacterium]
MSSNKKHYKITVAKAQSEMTNVEKYTSKIVHIPIVNVVLNNLERSVFRIIPMQFALVTTVTVGLLMISIAYFYGYQTSSLTTLGSVFILSFIVGILYDYVRSLIKQVK